MAERNLLIPVKACRPLEGGFRFGRDVVLAGAEAADRVALGQLRDDLARLGGAGSHARVVCGHARAAARSADLRLARSRDVQHPEGYVLTIRPEGIEIAAATAAGAYYGVQTLRDLLTIHGRTLPAMRIEDHPDLSRRAVYHDCSRGKVPKVATVLALVERLAHWKVNELQLYIENTFRYQSHPAIGRGFSPFTAADILRIQAHCKRHHVRLVGSLASFGHMEKILALPEYAHLGEAADQSPRQYKSDLCPVDPGSIRLMADLYGEFLPLLEARDFNACCDETWELGKGRSKKRAEKVGAGMVYLEFVLRLNRLCKRHGKRMNIWGDIILNHPELISRVPRDIVMCNWDYRPDGARVARTGEFVAAGLPLMCCPGVHGWKSHGTRMAAANANIAQFAGVARDHAAEGLLNTDWGDHGHRNTLGVSLHGLALGAACAWGGGQVRIDRFTEDFTFHAFGDKAGRLAAALRTLGAFSGAGLYDTFIEPLDPAAAWGHYSIGFRKMHDAGLTDEAVQNRLDEAAALRIPKIKVPQMFEALALAEFDLARRMDALACRRTLAGRGLRAGKPVPARTLRSLAADMQPLSEDFAALWLTRNRPSRLADNLAAMRATITEAEKLAR